MFKLNKLSYLFPTAIALVVALGTVAATAAPAQAVTTTSPSRSQARLETGIASIGDMVGEARGQGDMVRLNCVLDKRDRAGGVMQLADAEIRVIRDRNSADQARVFATEKLSAAADRLDGLVESARACDGDETPEERVDVTRTEAAEPRTIPINDPAAAASIDALPPVLDPAWLPVASGTE